MLAAADQRGGAMAAPSNQPTLVERVSRHIIVRVLLYIQAGLYVFVFVSILISPLGSNEQYWLEVIRQTIRNALLITFLLYARSYFANLTARRASSSLRRRDAAIMSLLFVLFITSDSWLWGILYAVPLSLLICLWEEWNIRRIERGPKAQG